MQRIVHRLPILCPFFAHFEPLVRPPMRSAATRRARPRPRHPPHPPLATPGDEPVNSPRPKGTEAKPAMKTADPLARAFLTEANSTLRRYLPRIVECLR